jgi:hypothetical protein
MAHRMNPEKLLGQLVRSACAAVALYAATITGTMAAPEFTPWDRQLPEARLTDVHLRAQSLEDAWQRISKEAFVRSVLLVRDTSRVTGEFRYDSSAGSVRSLLDALVRSYPDFKWQQDAQSGVIWILPKDMPMSGALPQAVVVNADQYGIPLLNGVILPLVRNGGLHLGLDRVSAALRNTFNYSIDIPAGNYSLREILNLACGANPTKSFYIRVTDSASAITPYNMVSDESGNLLSNIQGLWRLTGTSASEPLTLVNIRALLPKALADGDWRVRRAARWTLEASVWLIPFDDWLTTVPDADQTVWLALALTDILARDAEATERAAVEKLKMRADSAFIQTAPAPLALYASLEIFRLAEDDAPLRKFAARRLSGAERAQIQAQWGVVASLLARSPKVRELFGKADPRVAFLRQLAPKGAADISEELRFEIK